MGTSRMIKTEMKKSKTRYGGSQEKTKGLSKDGSGDTRSKPRGKGPKKGQRKDKRNQAGGHARGQSNVRGVNKAHPVGKTAEKKKKGPN